MKRYVVGLLLICMVLVPAAAYEQVDLSYTDARVLGLSGAYTAVADDSGALYMNPAGLHTMNESSMSIRLDMLEQFDSQLLLEDGWTELLKNPQLNGEFQYTTRNWGVSAYTKYVMDIDNEGDEYTFDITKVNSLKFGLAGGLGPLSFGADIRATMYGSEVNVIDFSESSGVVIPFIQEVLLDDYTDISTENVVLGAGILLDIGNFSFGAYSSDFVTIYDSKEPDGDLQFSLDSVLNTLNAGAAYQSRSYTKAGNFHPLQFTLALDIHDLGDDSERTIHLGSEFNLRFFEYMQFALRAGYQEDLEELDEMLFGLSMIEGDYTLGIGTVLPFLKIDGAVSVPGEHLMYMMDPEGSHDPQSLTGQITFGFAF